MATKNGKARSSGLSLSPIPNSLESCKGPYVALGLSLLAGKTAALKFKPPPGPMLECSRPPRPQVSGVWLRNRATEFRGQLVTETLKALDNPGTPGPVLEALKIEMNEAGGCS